MFISLSFTRIAQAGWKGNFINCFWNVCICLSVNVRKLLHATWWISGKLCIYWICILKQYISCSITMYLILAKNDYTCWYKSYHDIWLIKSMLWKMACNNLYLHPSTPLNVEPFNECMLPLRLWLDSCSWRGVYIFVPTHGRIWIPKPYVLGSFVFSVIRW